jgi:hypothetical protein
VAMITSPDVEWMLYVILNLLIRLACSCAMGSGNPYFWRRDISLIFHMIWIWLKHTLALLCRIAPGSRCSRMVFVGENPVCGKLNCTCSVGTFAACTLYLRVFRRHRFFV